MPGIHSNVGAGLFFCPDGAGFWKWLVRWVRPPMLLVGRKPVLPLAPFLPLAPSVDLFGDRRGWGAPVGLPATASSIIPNQSNPREARLDHIGGFGIESSRSLFKASQRIGLPERKQDWATTRDTLPKFSGNSLRNALDKG